MVLVLILAIVGWAARRPLLVVLGDALVAEDGITPVDVIVVSNASARAAALEAAELYRAGVSARIAIAEWIDDPLDAELHCRGVPILGPTALARAVLEHSGVPSAAIVQLPGPVEGTEDEILVVADYVRAQRLTGVLYLAPRTHGARARRLLGSRLPPPVHVAVRSPRLDDFRVDGWWYSREQSREVMSEYLRWVNSIVFGDAWRTSAHIASATPIECSCCGRPGTTAPGTRTAAGAARDSMRHERDE